MIYVIMTIRDNRDYIRVLLLCSYYTNITGFPYSLLILTSSEPEALAFWLS